MADRCGALHVGDILLGVNGHNVNKLDAEKVKDSIIRNTNTLIKYSN